MDVPCILLLFSLFSFWLFFVSPHIPLLRKSLELDLNLLFLQSLEFDLIVYAPYRSIDGFVNDMEVSMINPFLMKIFCFLICTRKLICLWLCVLIFNGFFFWHDSLILFLVLLRCYIFFLLLLHILCCNWWQWVLVPRNSAKQKMTSFICWR